MMSIIPTEDILRLLEDTSWDNCRGGGFITTIDNYTFILEATGQLSIQRKIGSGFFHLLGFVRDPKLAKLYENLAKPDTDLVEEHKQFRAFVSQQLQEKRNVSRDANYTQM